MCSVTIEKGVHPVPFRTRQLSPSSPRVLRCSPWEGRTLLITTDGSFVFFTNTSREMTLMEHHGSHFFYLACCLMPACRQGSSSSEWFSYPVCCTATPESLLDSHGVRCASCLLDHENRNRRFANDTVAYASQHPAHASHAPASHDNQVAVVVSRVVEDAR